MVVGMSAWATNYKLVTSADGLVAGKNYIIASVTSGDGYVISTESNTNNRRTTAATSSNGVITSDEKMMIFTLGGKDGAWTFTTTNYLGTNGNLYNNETGNNRLKVGDDTDTDKFTISFANGAISSITCNGNTSRGVMCFNGTLVACYTSKSNAYKVPQLYVEDETAVVNPYTVSFDAGEGKCSTTSIKETEGGKGVTLPECTPASADYKFIGWATSSDATTADAGVAGATYHPQGDCTLYAIYKQYYTVTVVAPENGTLSVKCGDVDVKSGDKFLYGEKLVITATPAEGYLFKNILVTDATEHKFTVNPKTWNMGESAITISAVFETAKIVNVTWSVNGTTSTSSLVDGTAIDFAAPSTTTIDGKTFMGWVSEEIEGTTDVAPTFVTSATATEDVTYYAVFANAKEGNSNTAKLSCTAIEANTSYSQTKATDDKGNEWNLYTNIAKQDVNNESHYFFGLNSNANGYNIQSPKFSGSIISIKAAVWNTSSTKTRYAYLCSTDKEAQPKEGDLGSMTINPSTKNVEQSFVLENGKDFSQFYIYASTQGAIGLEWIEVTYGEPTVYSGYCTSVSAPTSYSLTISPAEYATFYDSKNAYVMPEDCEGYVFTVANGLELAYESGETVPAGEPLVIYTIEPGTKELVYTTSTEDTYKSGDMNDLEGTDEETALEADANSYFYALTLDKEGKNVGFYWMNATGAAFTNGAHKAYLMAAGSPANAKNFIFGETTAIKTIATATDAKIYDLTGREVKSPKAGIYVVNGVKKYIK